LGFSFCSPFTITGGYPVRSGYCLIFDDAGHFFEVMPFLFWAVVALVFSLLTKISVIAYYIFSIKEEYVCLVYESYPVVWYSLKKSFFGQSWTVCLVQHLIVTGVDITGINGYFSAGLSVKAANLTSC
jgi:hypothetical protein